MINFTGPDNTALGEGALKSSIGNRNIAVGKNAGGSPLNGDDNIYIGSDSGSDTEDGQIRIGAASQRDCFIQGIHGASVDSATDLPVFVDSTGKLGTMASSKQYKSNVIDMDDASDGLMDLRPVKFTYKHDSNNNLHYGLIVEEVEELYPELVVRDNSGNTYSVRYHELPAMLLNELQKNREMITSLKETAKDLLTEQKQNNAVIKDLLTRIVVLEELTGK